MSHDILIRIDHKIESSFYATLLEYIGENNNKIHKKESNKKNGVRIILKYSNGKITKRQIKRWAQSKHRFLCEAIVMDIDPSINIYNALLTSLTLMDSAKKENARKLLKSYFECIKQNNEKYSHRLTILGEIYRILEMDAHICNNSNTLCKALKKADNIF